MAAALLLLLTLVQGWGADAVPATAPASAVVVTIKDPSATEAFRTQPQRIQAMVEKGLTGLTGKSSPEAACRSLVSTQDVVGIKVYSVPGPYSGTRPAVVEALAKCLLSAGIRPTNIIIWDRQLIDLRLAGFVDLGQRLGVRVLASAQAGYDETVFYEDALLGNLIWGDLEFGKKGDSVGRKSFVSKLLTKDITKIICVSPLLNHNTAGVSGNLYSLVAGSVDNFARFEPSVGRMATAVPEIYALPPLGERVVLNITDALIGQYEGGERGLLHYSATLNELRFSRDPVALDVLSIEELERLRKSADAPPGQTNKDLYYNASLLELGVSDPKKIQRQPIQ